MQIPEPLRCGAVARLLATIALCLAANGGALADAAPSEALIPVPVLLGPGAPPAPGIAASPVSVDAYREALRERFMRSAAATRAAGTDAGTESPGDRTLGTSDEAGGDDVLIATHADMAAPWAYSFDIAENGDLYAAVEVYTVANGSAIHVYRSTDDGDTWALWGSIGDHDPGTHFREPIIHVAEGDQNRVYLAYQKRVDPTDRDIWVSYAPSAGVSAVWTDRQVMDQPGVDYEFPDLTSDAEVNGTFKLFLVATGIDGGDGDDLWFASSTDFGATWQPEYVYWQIETSDFDAWFPKVAYGANGIVHTTWEQRRRAGTFVESLYYRRTYNNGATYADFADTAWIYTTTGDAYRERDPAISASHASEKVVITYTLLDSLTFSVQPPRVAYSTNAGHTFTVVGSDLGQPQASVDLIALPGTEGFRSAGDFANNFGAQSASDAAPNVWTSMEFLSDRPYPGSNFTGPEIDYNQTLDNRVGMIWTRLSGTGSDSLFFDAEWRADPGYPNLVAGFPKVLPADAVSAPALCELDGDPENEIVYGDADGNIQAFNHDGAGVPGWPVDIGNIPYDGAVAVGDLDGDGNNEVVCGNTTGEVYAFRNNGTPLPGWPYYIGATGVTFACIGQILATSHRQVVAAGHRRLILLDPTGTPAPGWPVFKPSPFAGMPAIGDVDNDGDREIVALFGGFVGVHRADGSVQALRDMSGAGKTFVNAPSLGDLNLDGDLEIMAPSQQGDLYVLNPDGTDLAGWPYVDPSGSPITSVAIAQARAGFEPELAFGVENNFSPAVHARYATNVELGGYPHSTTPGYVNLGAPIWEVIDEGSSDLVLASLDRSGRAWDNFGAEVPGWPKGLVGAAVVGPASGDIDHDGDLEIVFLANNPPRMTIVDVGAAVQRQASRRGWYWPMFGYNPQRTACWLCQPDNVVGIGEEGPAPRSLTFHAPAPNPSAGAMAFRFDVPERGAVRLGLYDVTGRSVRELIKEEMDAGERAVRWDGRTKDGGALPAGVYYARLTVQSASGENVAVRKVTLLP